ncbi:hypothetical protein FRC07_010806 [Ceratobasidium sp. 392]|nr:hypothetical protein FRC07_010806 [Ceratobasidium sp. 392]
MLDVSDLVRDPKPAKEVEEEWADYLGLSSADSNSDEGPPLPPLPNPQPTPDTLPDLLDPASIHHCFAWVAHGQNGHKPPVTSTKLRAAFRSKESLAAFLAHHIGKSMADQRINNLILHFHLVFYRLMCQLHHELFEAELPPPVLWDVWSSGKIRGVILTGNR